MTPLILSVARVETHDSPAMAGVMTVMDAAFHPEFGEAWTEPQLRGSLSLPGTSLLAATRGAETCGFALLRALAGEAELLLLAVHPRFRRTGIGKTLLIEAMNCARLSQAEHMFLEVRDGNSAVSLYLAHGFEAYHRRAGYYIGGNGVRFDAISLRSALQQ